MKLQGQSLKYTDRDVRKILKFWCYKGNVKFDNTHDVFE